MSRASCLSAPAAGRLLAGSVRPCSSLRQVTVGYRSSHGGDLTGSWSAPAIVRRTSPRGTSEFEGTMTCTHCGAVEQRGRYCVGAASSCRRPAPLAGCGWRPATSCTTPPSRVLLPGEPPPLLDTSAGDVCPPPSGAFRGRPPTLSACPRAPARGARAPGRRRTPGCRTGRRAGPAGRAPTSSRGRAAASSPAPAGSGRPSRRSRSR